MFDILIVSPTDAAQNMLQNCGADVSGGLLDVEIWGGTVQWKKCDVD